MTDRTRAFRHRLPLKVGSLQDVIISGGYNVHSKEFELEIDLIPDVLESAVVGLPHPDFGERVVAAAVPTAGGAAGERDGVAVLKDGWSPTSCRTAFSA